MKVLPILAIIFFTTYATAQEIKQNSEGVYECQVIKDVKNTSKDKLFGRAKLFFAKAYKSSKDVVQLSDKEVGKIVGKGIFVINVFKKADIYHTITIDVKDNKYRCTITDFVYYSRGSGKMSFEKRMMMKKKIIRKTQEKVNNTLKELESIMSKNDDW